MTIRKSAIVLAVVALGAAVVGYGVYARNSQAAEHLQAARQALGQGDFSQADYHLALYLKARPEDRDAHFLAAQVARRAVLPALPDEDDVMQPSPPTNLVASYDRAKEHLVAYQHLGGAPERIQLEVELIQAQQGDLRPVEGRLRELVQSNHPDRLLILEALVKGYLVNYRMPEAEHGLDLWLGAREDLQALLLRGWMCERGHQYNRALGAYRRILELAPENDDAELRLAQLLITASQPKEALEHFQRLHKRQPENAAVLLGLARSLGGLGEREKARPILDRLLDQQPDNPKALVERGTLELQDKKPAQAEVWARKALATIPWDRPATYLLYLCLEQGGKKEEAREWSARLADIEADLKQIDEATRKVAVSPHEAAWRYEAGAILLCHGLTDEGLGWLRSALHENPQHQPTRTLLAEFERLGHGLDPQQFIRNAHAALATYYENLGDPHLKAFVARHRQLALADSFRGEGPGVKH